MEGMRRAVFLDRDGVLNRAVVRHGKPYPPPTVEDVELLPGVIEACAALHQARFLLIVATNQPDVALGSQRQAVVEAIHAVLRARLALDDVRVCYHSEADACPCRKPKPGLLVQAAQEWGVDLRGSFMVGDRWKDIEAGWRVGCKTVLIDYGYAEGCPRRPDHRVRSLAEASGWILTQGAALTTREAQT